MSFLTVSNRASPVVWKETASHCVAFRIPEKEGVSRWGSYSTGWLEIWGQSLPVLQLVPAVSKGKWANDGSDITLLLYRSDGLFCFVLFVIKCMWAYWLPLPSISVSLRLRVHLEAWWSRMEGNWSNSAPTTRVSSWSSAPLNVCKKKRHIWLFARLDNITWFNNLRTSLHFHTV